MKRFKNIKKSRKALPIAAKGVKNTVSNRFTLPLNRCKPIWLKIKIVSSIETISFQKVKRFAICNILECQLYTYGVKRFETHIKQCESLILLTASSIHHVILSFHF